MSNETESSRPRLRQTEMKPLIETNVETETNTSASRPTATEIVASSRVRNFSPETESKRLVSEFGLFLMLTVGKDVVRTGRPVTGDLLQSI